MRATMPSITTHLEPAGIRYLSIKTLTFLDRLPKYLML